MFYSDRNCKLHETGEVYYFYRSEKHKRDGLHIQIEQNNCTRSSFTPSISNFFTLTDIMYASSLTVSLIITFKLHHRRRSISYLGGKPACLYAPSDNLFAHANMADNLFLLRTANSKINAAIGSATGAIEPTTPSPSAKLSPVGKSHIFAFSKPTSDLNI